MKKTEGQAKLYGECGKQRKINSKFGACCLELGVCIKCVISNQKSQIQLLSLFLILTLFSCSTQGFKKELADLGALPKQQQAPYLEVLNSSSKTVKVYDQFDTKAIIKVTYFSGKFTGAYMEERKKYHNEAQYGQFAERETSVNEKNIRFFVGFYTPNPDYTDIEKNTSIWQVYIVKPDGSKIYPGSVKKGHEPFPVLNYFFPYLDTWSVPYFISFGRFDSEKPVLASGAGFKLIFKSVFGEALFEFNLD